jgi:hypothetical protein
MLAEKGPSSNTFNIKIINLSGQRKEFEEVDSNPSLISSISDLHNSFNPAFHI